MAYTRLKLCVVVVGLGWSLLLILVMSSLKWQPGDVNAALRRSLQPNLPDNIPLARAAKSHVLLGELIDAAKAKNGSSIGESNNNLPRGPTQNTTDSSLLNSGKAVQVVISGDADSVVGVVAAINSVVSNTKSDVHFFVTLPRIVIPPFRKWMQTTKLQKVEYTVQPHVSQIPRGKPHFAKIYLEEIFPDLAGKFIYLDSAVIVQGDIKEMADIPIKPSQFGVFPEDCSSASKRSSMSRTRYSTHINFQHPKLKGAKIKPKTCTFNTDVFVSNVTLWKIGNVSRKLIDFVNSSSDKNPIYGLEPDTDEAEAAMLIVMYQHSSPLPHLWHIGDLGMTSSASFSQQFISRANLLHWNGHFKPWNRLAAFMELWDKYYITDPDGKFKPTRKLL